MDRQRNISIVLLIVGVISIILGIICFKMEVGIMIGYEKYGGDAYTGIQNAVAKTGRNIVTTNEILKFGFGSILSIAGLVLTIFSINILWNLKESSRTTTKSHIKIEDLNELKNNDL